MRITRLVVGNADRALKNFDMPRRPVRAALLSLSGGAAKAEPSGVPQREIQQRQAFRAHGWCRPQNTLLAWENVTIIALLSRQPAD
jgi:hypothetical protein